MLLYAVLILCATTAFADDKVWISLDNGNATLQVAQGVTSLKLTVTYDGEQKLAAEIGKDLSLDDITQCSGLNHCIILETDIRLHVTSHISNGFDVYWSTTNVAKTFRDCYSLSLGHWYGGPEWRTQEWPIEKLEMAEFAYVTNNDHQAAVVERYWLNSLGGYIYVDERVPLFLDQNHYLSNFVCFSAKAAAPYINRDRVLLQYTVVAEANPKEAQLNAVDNFLGKPSDHPNPLMIQRPIWSTWARYYRDINDSVVLNFASEIMDNGYANGQLEIDDFWETCYGSLTFDKGTSKFPDIENTVKTLKDKGFRVTLWTHPFVNTNCAEYTATGQQNNFFVKGSNGNPLTTWWNSDDNRAQYLDFTNAEVRGWFADRLVTLREEVGLDSFKFDAGESSWAPALPVLRGDAELHPNQLTSDYVRTCAQFGNLVEVRSAWKTQDLPVFVRMIDKDSNWGVNNGLYTLVTTLLQMNIAGYTNVLPDMVGGNGYDGNKPDGELFVRWLQANTFMPAIQFSIVPWDFEDDDYKIISKKFVDLHDEYADQIVAAMQKSITDGYPVNAPIWWVDPDFDEALACDTQYLLGENILVAPILEQGATSRDIVIPKGSWKDGNTGVVYDGRQVLRNYSAPIDVLPYFVREESWASAATANTAGGVILGVFVLVAIRFLH